LNSKAPRPPAPVAAARLVLAFDYGRRRIGVACGDTLSRTARPLTGIATDADGPLWASVAAVLRDWQPALIVVGLPYNADDSEGAMAKAVRGFAREVETRYALEVRLVDERYSSLEAASRLRSERESGARKRKVAKADVDAAAACIILERWFIEGG
jgi:putative Holliday junction resolvase